MRKIGWPFEIRRYDEQFAEGLRACLCVVVLLFWCLLLLLVLLLLLLLFVLLLEAIWMFLQPRGDTGPAALPCGTGETRVSVAG